MSYNLLPPVSGTPQAFPKVPEPDLNWANRRETIIRYLPTVGGYGMG